MNMPESENLPGTERQRTWPEMHVNERRQVLDAVVTMVTTMGGACSTAYLVAAEMAYGMEAPAERPRRFPRA